MSNDLRYFCNKPKDIKFWEMKKEFNLALFVVMKDYPLGIKEEIKKLQKKIKNQLKSINFLDNIDEVEKKGLKENGAYIYPPKDFHFTLINFLKYSVDFKYMPIVDSEELRNLVMNYRGYEEIKNEIQEAIEKAKEKLKLCIAEADLRWIYSGDEKGIDSISLQVFPREGFINELKKIERITNNYTDRFPWPRLGVKANPKYCPVAFTMNILRFIKNTEKEKLKLKSQEECKKRFKERDCEEQPNKSELSEENIKNIIKCIEKINKKHDKKPLRKIKIEKITLHEVNDAFFHKKDDGIPFTLNNC